MFRPYINLIIHKATKFESLNTYNCLLWVRLMHLISIISFKLGHVSIPKRRAFSPFFLLCACDISVLQNINIFTPSFSYGTLFMTEVDKNHALESTRLYCQWTPNVITSTIGQDKFPKLSLVLSWLHITNVKLWPLLFLLSAAYLAEMQQTPCTNVIGIGVCKTREIQCYMYAGCSRIWLQQVNKGFLLHQFYCS
jgi:hypothetical protein